MNAEHLIDALKVAPTAGFALTSVTGVVHWDTISYIVATAYTSLMIGNFFWIKLIKPYVLRKVAAVSVGHIDLDTDT